MLERAEAETGAAGWVLLSDVSWTPARRWSACIAAAEDVLVWEEYVGLIFSQRSAYQYLKLLLFPFATVEWQCLQDESIVNERR